MISASLPYRLFAFALLSVTLECVYLPSKSADANPANGKILTIVGSCQIRLLKSTVWTVLTVNQAILPGHYLRCTPKGVVKMQMPGSLAETSVELEGTRELLIVLAPLRPLLPNRYDQGDIGGRQASIQGLIDRELQPSTLAKEAQADELLWFAQVGHALRSRGITEITVASKTLATHEYESKTLTVAFEQITGIKVRHQLLSETALAAQFRAALMGGKATFDGWIASSDLLGTAYRSGNILSLSDYMAGPGSGVTSPTLDLRDFIGLEFATGPDKQLYQLPDQQAANLYWYRADLFGRKDLQDRFKNRYGYNLDVPANWTAYEDIARFFTDDVRETDGKRVYGHMDYGKGGVTLNFVDAWMSISGVGDVGTPNGLPVDEWGIRVASDGCTPVGASTARGGATNSPAAVFALSKYVDWLQNYAPKAAFTITPEQHNRVFRQDDIAQQLTWYSSLATDLTKPASGLLNPDGTPKWRVAPAPTSPYWKKGMQGGYQDVGAWTFLKEGNPDRTAAAWLYAQFTTSKSVSLKKSIVGLTFIRDSDIRSDYFSKNAAKYGGLVEFYRSPARAEWTPNGSNSTDYLKFAKLWDFNVATALSGQKSPQQAMDSLAFDIDQAMSRSGRASVLRCPPKLNPKKDPSTYLTDSSAPWKKLDDESPPGMTITYGDSLKRWKEDKAR